MVPVEVTGTPADEKGKEVEGSYGKIDHVIVGTGKRLQPAPSWVSQRLSADPLKHRVV